MRDGVVIGEPVLKTIKIHLSDRVKDVIAVMALCQLHRNEQKGYFSYYGNVYGWGFSYKGDAPLTFKLLEVGDGRANDMSFTALQYPSLKWFSTNLSDDGKRLHHIIIEDSGGVVFDDMVTNPCIEGMSLPSNGIIPI